MVKKLLNLKIRFFIFTLLFLGVFSVYANTAATKNTTFSLLNTKAVVDNTSSTYGENITLSKNLSFVNYLWVDTPTAQAGFKEVFQNLEIVLLKDEVDDNEKEEVLKGTLLATANCKSITVYLDATGNVSITEDAINNASTGVGPLIFDTDITFFTCANIGSPVNVTLTVTDDSSTDTCSTTVTVVDNQLPTIATLAAATVNADSGVCTYASSQLPKPTATDNCTTVTVTRSPATLVKGLNTVTWTATDGAGLTATSTQEVTVVDAQAPIITCPSDQNVSFGANCEFILPDYTSLAIASDNCSTPIITQSPAPGTAISGQTTITLTATDSANNKSTCTFEVIPKDNEPPTAVSQNITVNLSPSGTVNISALDVNNGSSDNCPGFVMSVSPNSFNCSNVGANMVTFTVVDDAGNSASSTATVTVVDNTPPIMLCNDFVVVIDPITRKAIIKPEDVDNGSNDACGAVVLTLSQYEFPENLTGTPYTRNDVILTATDVNGNSNTCTVAVTVEPPVNQDTYLTGVIIDPVPTYPQPPSALIEATSCPGGLYDPKDVQFTLEAIGTYNLQTSDVIHWEYSEDNGETWVEIPGTSGQLIYTLNNIIKNTFVRLSITNTVTGSVQSSATAFVRFLPPDEPPIIVSNSSLNICLGESVTVVAESFFDQQEGQFGEGGKFNYAQPDGWRVDGLDGEFPASGNNTTAPTWKETNSVANPNKTFSGINYDTSDNTKFAIAHSVISNHVTTLETPVFSTVGMTASEAILSFHQGYYFCGDASGTIELSFDAGNTYGVTLATYSNSSTGVSLLGDSCSKEYPMADPFEEILINLGAYVGYSGLRIKFTFDSGADGGFCDDVSFPKDPTNGCNKTQLYDVGSGWAIDDVGFVFSQVDDELEWTDENNTVIAIGNTATVTPVTPGIRRYGVTTLINGCRTDDDTGTNFIDIATSLAYAGEDYLPVAGNCGEASLQLNAYDNTKKAIDNFNKGAWKNNLYVVPANASEDFVGTGVKGVWSIVSSNVTSPSCGSLAGFSANDDPDAVFTGNPGTYKLRWTLSNGCFDEIDVKISDCNSINFDGGNDYVTFKNNYNLNSDFSIETWVKPNSVTGTQTVFSRKDTDDNTSGYDLSIVNGQVRFKWYYSSGSGSVTSTHSIDTSRWFHIAVTFNGATYKLYVDGIELGSVNNSNPPNTTGNNIEALLGAMYQVSSGVPVNYYNGWVDELKIWNKALSVEHIRQMMNQEIDELGADVGGVVIPTKIYGPDNDNNGTEDNPLLWNNLVGYYHMNIVCGDMAPYKKGVNGRLRNITSSQEQSAPIPYTSTTTGIWDNINTWNNKTIWTTKYVWDVPNSNGINGDPIDWNIVKTGHEITSGVRNITLLGLLSDVGKLTIDGSTNMSTGTGTGQGLWITHYLKLNGIIDLEGESQLVQKRYTSSQFNESLLDASSSGYIERDQQIQGNLYNYDDLSSPVGLISQPQTTLYNLRDVLKDGRASSYGKNINFIASLDGTTATAAVSISTRWIYGYKNGAGYKFTTQFNVGEGNTLKGSFTPAEAAASLQNFVYIGKPHNGLVQLTLSDSKHYLVGNPYPSALDADQFILDNLDSTTGVLKFYEDWSTDNSHIERQASVGYAYYTLAGGVGSGSLAGNLNSPGDYGTKIPKRYIPIAQAFWVVGGGTGNMVKFNNNQRVFEKESDPSSIFFKGPKSKNNNSISGEEDKRLKIRVGFESSKVKNRQLLLTIDNRASDGIDKGFDAVVSNIMENDFYWVNDDNKLVIQAIGDLMEDRVVPIGITAKDATLLKIKVDTIENSYPNMEVYLRDNMAMDTYDIKNGEFEITLEPGEYNDKYAIVFQPKVEIPIEVEELYDDLHVFMSENNTVISIRKPEVLLIKGINLYNVIGQQVQTWNSNLGESEIDLPVQIGTGVYLVYILTNKGNITRKVIIK